MSKKKRKQKGFTLLELLVVVTIIAILLGAGVYFYSGFSRDAKATKLAEAMQEFYNAYQGCIMKNASLLTNPPQSFDDLRNVLTDSQCRTLAQGQSDQKGLASQVNQQIAGFTLNLTTMSWAGSNVPVLSTNTGDPAIATNVVKKLPRMCWCGNDTTTPVNDAYTCNDVNVSCLLYGNLNR